MEPRLSTSRKWSPLPKELTEQIQSVFKQNFKNEIGGGTVESDGKIYPGEILVRIGFREKGSLKQANFGVSIAYKANKDNVIKLLHLAVDAAAALFEQYFAAESDQDFPLLWEEVDFEKRKIYVIYNTVNSELESEANKLLGVQDSSDELAQGDWDEDLDPDSIKSQLGLDGEEIGVDVDESDDDGKGNLH